MGFVIFFAIALAIFVVIDIYTYRSIQRSTERKWIRNLYWLVSIAGYIYMITTLFQFDAANEDRKVLNGFMSWIVIWYAPKLFIIPVLLIEDVIRLTIGLYRIIKHPERKDLGQRFVPGRRQFIHNTILGLAAIPFVGVIHGIWKGKYNFRVIKKTIFFDDLPEAFDGFTITQVSDIHSGSFDNREKIEYAVDLIKEQNSDLFLFTGDMVNIMSEEILPWRDLFATVRAPYGQYSILGNHDYGTYRTWDSDPVKNEQLAAADVDELVRIQNEEIGYRNLRNESVKIEKDGQYIDLVGVENWGVGFMQAGDLDKAMEGLDADSFKILLSHDPTHFDEVVKHHKKKVNLTLSGHTHGMQFGIEIPGIIKWSPASWRYPKWAGLYKDMGKYLYVNRGFGYLAYPGRTGIWPEITVFELRKGNSESTS